MPNCLGGGGLKNQKKLISGGSRSKRRGRRNALKSKVASMLMHFRMKTHTIK